MTEKRVQKRRRRKTAIRSFWLWWFYCGLILVFSATTLQMLLTGVFTTMTISSTSSSKITSLEDAIHQPRKQDETKGDLVLVVDGMMDTNDSTNEKRPQQQPALPTATVASSSATASSTVNSDASKPTTTKTLIADGDGGMKRNAEGTIDSSTPTVSSTVVDIDDTSEPTTSKSGVLRKSSTSIGVVDDVIFADNKETNTPSGSTTEESIMVAEHSTTIESTNTTTTTPDEQKQQQQHVILYSHARRDRSGAAMVDALLSHAYVFRMNNQQEQGNNTSTTTTYEYGGICNTQHDRNNILTPYNDLLSLFGLDHVILWNQCPNNENNNNHNTREEFIDRYQVTQMGPETLFTKEWIDTIRSIRRQQSQEEEQQDNDDHIFKIAIHIRRGDVSPCWVSNRYLSNDFFLELIPQVLKNVTTTSSKDIQVIIYTEQISFEPLEVFLNHPNITQVVMGGNITNVWKEMDKADVLVQSPSTFSIIPALLSTKQQHPQQQQIYHVPFTEWKLPKALEWQLVNKTLLEQNKVWIKQHNGKVNKHKYCHERIPKVIYNYTSTGKLISPILQTNNTTTNETITTTRKEEQRDLLKTTTTVTTTTTNTSSSQTTAATPTTIASTTTFDFDLVPDYIKNATTLYTKSRLDRSGMIVLDALMGHAYATKYNKTYGGVCGPSRHYHLNHEALYDVWNLDGEVVPLITNSCLFMKPERDVFIDQKGIVEREWHHELFTTKWRKQIKTLRQITTTSNATTTTTTTTTIDNSMIQLGVHIRRGDVSPCRWNQRYLNNDFFLEFIPQVIANLTKDDAATTSVNVTIFTEDLTFEPLDVFQERGYNLYIGGNLFDIWRHMDSDIDVIIMSPSSFSMVPALLSKRIKTVYTPPFERWKTPLDGWFPVNLTLVEQSKKWMGKRLHRNVKYKYCGPGNKPVYLYNYTTITGSTRNDSLVVLAEDQRNHETLSSTEDKSPTSSSAPLQHLLQIPPYLRKNETLPSYLNQTRRLFSHARTDRSGAAMLSAFLAHAYAYYYGIPFEGICGRTSYDQIHQQVIQTWGLSHVFKWQSCPTTSDTNIDTYVDRSEAGMRGLNTKMLTPEWIEVIRSLRNMTTTTTKRRQEDDNITNVAVHVRRGDISPCKYFRRYFPNSFYLDVIDQLILPKHPNANITIYTEDETFESVQDFVDRDLRVVCGGDLNQVWSEMDTDYDILITSASTFSYIPAILSTRLRRVIYVQNKEWNPLESWELVDPELIESAQLKVLQMKGQNCSKGRSRQYHKCSSSITP